LERTDSINNLEGEIANSNLSNESQRALINGLEEVKLVDMVYSTKGSEYITSQSINTVSAQIYPYHEIIDPENVPNVYGVTPSEIKRFHNALEATGVFFDPADWLNTGVYALERDYRNAAWSAGSGVVGLGMAAPIFKHGIKYAPDFAKGAGKFGDDIVESVKLPVSGINLAKQLASEAQMAEKGVIIISSGRLREAVRLAKQYGGKPIDWVKKSSSSFAKDGTKFETHWYENISTGVRAEPKTKFP
jgi:hypothetical protein